MKDAGASCAAAASHLPPRLRASTVAARAGDPSVGCGGKLKRIATGSHVPARHPVQSASDLRGVAASGAARNLLQELTGEELTMTALAQLRERGMGRSASKPPKPAGRPGREPLAIPEPRGSPPRRCTVPDPAAQPTRHPPARRAHRRPHRLGRAATPPQSSPTCLACTRATGASLENSHSSPSSFSRPFLAACTSAGSDR